MPHHIDQKTVIYRSKITNKTHDHWVGSLSSEQSNNAFSKRTEGT